MYGYVFLMVQYLCSDMMIPFLSVIHSFIIIHYRLTTYPIRPITASSSRAHVCISMGSPHLHPPATAERCKS